MPAPGKKNDRKVMLRVTGEGSFIPADGISQRMCRKKKLRTGAVVSAVLSLPRDYQAWKRAHKLAQLMVENTDEFSGFDTHAALKRLQVESGAACDLFNILTPDGESVEYRIPRSMAFDEMDELEFGAAYTLLCQHVVNFYWQSMTPDQVDAMASLVDVD